MKHLVCLFALMLMTSSCLAQFDFEQDSLEGWYQSPPGRWEITSEEAIEGERSLHHAFDNPESGTDLVGTDLSNPDLEDTLSFSFRIRHGYAPSSSNNWQFFCLKDQPEGFKESAASGIVFGVNYTGYDDHLKIWQLGDAHAHLICDTGLDYQEVLGTKSAPLFRLTRLPTGTWTVEYSAGGETESLIIAGSGQEQGECNGKFMVFRYAYSSSQDRKMWIDAIQVRGRFYRDSLPPVVTGLHLPSPCQLEIKFSEPIASFDPAGFQWNIRVPDSVRHTGSSLQLYFPLDFPNRVPQQIRISGVTDGEGNLMKDTLVNFRQDLAEYGDVIISELMTDPEPVVYLPPCEYIELFNRHDSPVDISGWKIRINSREYELDQGVIDPGACLLLTHYGCVAAFKELPVQGIISVATALTNSGGVVTLEDRFGRPVHRVEYGVMERYDMDWSGGGWSLERADPDFLCGGRENWRIPDDPQGGSPGRSNARHVQYTDDEPPMPVAMGIKGDTMLIITFNEELYISAKEQGVFMLNGTRLMPGAQTYPLVDETIRLPMGEALEVGQEQELVIGGVLDCPGNRMSEQVISFRLPSSPQNGIPQLCEVMYDPVPGGCEYIEIRNHGKDCYDLYDLGIRISEPGSEGGSVVGLSDVSRILLPGEYVVLTRSGYALKQEWQLEDNIAVFTVPSMHALTDDGACIALTNRAGRVIDQVCYHDSLHQDLLGVTSGVALERITTGICSVGSQCWTSAASSAGYGTPGRPNSQTLYAGFQEKTLVLEPKVISPDGDGQDDFMEIRITGDGTAAVQDVFITDLDGFVVRKLMTVGIPGTTDHLVWSGRDDHGQLVRPGIYVVHLRISGSSGIRQVRSACAVTYR